MARHILRRQDAIVIFDLKNTEIFFVCFYRWHILRRQDAIGIFDLKNKEFFSSSIGGIFFVDKMRRSGFSTLLDPFHHKFGRVMGCLLYLPALSAEVFWSAAILNALGTCL